MKKWIVTHGSVRLSQADVPTIAPGQLLIQVHAVSLVSIDLPLAGTAFSGTVLQSYEECKWLPGARVWGRTDQGALSEIIVVPEWAVYKMRTNLTFEEAATLAGPGLMACKALQMATLPAEGRPKILVHGGHTALGTFAIQAARVLKCDVEATTAPDDRAQCKELGVCDLVDLQDDIDYGTTLASFRGRRPRNFHLVIDTLSDDASIYDNLEKFTHEGAKYITTKPQSVSWSASILRRLSGSPREYAYLDGSIRKDDAAKWFELVVRLISSPDFYNIELQDEYSFDDVEAAYAAVEKSSGFGCLVVSVTDAQSESFNTSLSQYKYHGQLSKEEYEKTKQTKGLSMSSGRRSSK